MEFQNIRKCSDFPLVYNYVDITYVFSPLHREFLMFLQIRLQFSHKYFAYQRRQRITHSCVLILIVQKLPLNSNIFLARHQHILFMNLWEGVQPCISRVTLFSPMSVSIRFSIQCYQNFNFSRTFADLFDFFFWLVGCSVCFMVVFYIHMCIVSDAPLVLIWFISICTSYQYFTD